MLKKFLLLLAVVCGLATPTLAATSTYTVYSTAGSIVCGSDAVCSTIKHLSVQTVTVSGAAGTALYTWNASCPSSPDAIFYIRPTGATTGCFVLEGFASSTGPGVSSVTGTTNQVTSSPTTGAVVLSLPTTLIAPGTFSATSVNVSGSTPSVNGLYLPSANTLGISVNSLQVGRFTSTGLNATNIGVTTPGSGSFTTVLASGAITPSQTAGIVGTTTNNNVNTGSVGEYVTCSVASPGTALTSGANVNICTISLTAGDWDVQGDCGFAPNAATLTTDTRCATNTSSGIFPTPGTSYTLISYGTTGITGISSMIPVVTYRYSLSTTTTLYLITSVGYTGTGYTGYGFMSARRVR